MLIDRPRDRRPWPVRSDFLSRRINVMKKMLAGVLVGAGALAASPAWSATTTGRLDVMLQVTPGCAFSSGSSGTPSGGLAEAVLNFGNTALTTDPGTAVGSVDGQAISAGSGSALSVVCSSTFVGPNAPTLTIDSGLHANGTQRRLVGPGGAMVAYNLYSDAGRNVSLDAGTPIQVVITGPGVATPVNIYGRVPDLTGASADGMYTDTVTMTLSY
jgi:spore coat protein U-like protein